MKKKILFRRACFMIYGLCIGFACIFEIAGLALFLCRNISGVQFIVLTAADIAVAGILCRFVYQTLIHPYPACKAGVLPAELNPQDFGGGPKWTRTTDLTIISRAL